MNLFIKQKQTYRHRKQTYGSQRGLGKEEINQELWINKYTLLCITQTIHMYTMYTYTMYNIDK